MPMTGVGPSASRSRTAHSAVRASASRGSNTSAGSLGWPSGRETDDRPAGLDQLASILDERRTHGRRRGGEQGHEVALPAAQEVVDRHPERLAADVVERDVDGRHRGREHPTALEVLAPVQPLPDGAASHRVGADDELPEVADRRRDGLLTRREPGLSPAMDAHIRLDLDQALRPDAHHRDERPDLGDAHLVLLYRAHVSHGTLPCGRSTPESTSFRSQSKRSS